MIAPNLADFVAMNAVRRAKRVALRDASKALTYAELGTAMLRCAQFLQNEGVGRGDVVGLTMRDGVDHMVAMLAIIRLGAVLLPLDPRWTSVEKDNVARVFEAGFAVTDEPGTCRLSTAKVIEHDAGRIAASAPDPVLPDDFSGDDPLLLSLSSGTTGTPKGPRITHRQMWLRHYTEWVSLGFLAEDVNLCATPLYFGGGRGFTLSYLIGGGTVVFCPPPYRPEDIAELIRAHGVTTTFLVPTLLRRVAEAPSDDLAALRSLRFIISSGSALHPAERRDLLQRVNGGLMNFYASTEGGGVAVLKPSDDEAVARSVGRPVLGSQVRITDEDGRDLPVGAIGHIRHRAPWHPAGFHRNPEQTARSFKDGWYLPGDLGYVDAEGYLFITGRSKEMIIRGGVNIYPDEIESVLIAHPSVSDAAVIGRPSPLLGEEVVAFVVGNADGAGPSVLMEHCRASLAPYKVPSAFLFLDELPRNSGGKVLKADLANLL